MDFKNREEFKVKKAFSLLEMMIAIVIMGILVGMAIPSYLEYIRKAEASVATSFMEQIKNGEVAYFATNGKYYASNGDFNRTLEVLNVGSSSAGEFEYGIKVGDSTFLIRANKPGDTNYVYMYYPPSNSNKISGYVEEEWSKNIYTVDYISHPATPASIDLTNDGTIVSTY